MSPIHVMILGMAIALVAAYARTAGWCPSPVTTSVAIFGVGLIVGAIPALVRDILDRPRREP